MKKLLILFLLLPSICYAAAPTRVATYTTGTVISSADVTANEDAIFNYVQAGVDTYSPLSIENVDIDATANIQSDKLNLTSIAQGVKITSSGSFTNQGSSTFAGTTIADLGTVTTAAFTAITDLGNVTTTGTFGLGGKLTAGASEIEGSAFDINGGTMDAVQVDGATATGMLYTNDASDDLSQLAAQGTSGQFLQSAGAGANPTFADETLSLTSVTAISSANSGNITIAANKIYRIVISITAISADDTVHLRFNSDTASAYFDLNVGAAQDYIILGGVDTGNASLEYLFADLTFDTKLINLNRVRVNGQVISSDTDGTGVTTQIHGHWIKADAITDFEIYATGAATLTGNVYLYTYSLS